MNVGTNFSNSGNKIQTSLETEDFNLARFLLYQNGNGLMTLVLRCDKICLSRTFKFTSDIKHEKQSCGHLPLSVFVCLRLRLLSVQISM